MESKTIFHGIKWTSFEFAFSFIFRFSIKLLLARILLPEDFGLVGMTSIFISILTSASELGMGAALIQKKENQYAVKLYNTAFWTSVIWGISLYLIICFLIGPFAAFFFKEPILIWIMPVLSIGVLLQPVNLISKVILTRSMNFKKIAFVQNTAAFFAGCIALLLAYLGSGVWAIVMNNSLAIFLTVPMYFMVVKWIPRWEWNKNYFNEIFGFGAYSTGTAIFSTATYNIDNMMIGKMLGSNLLGTYTLAFSLTEVLRQSISSVLNKVMYPVFGQQQDNLVKLKEYFLGIVRINAVVIYPIMFFLVLFGENVIIDVFGDKWAASIIPMKILAVAVMIHLIINSFTALLRGMGYPNLEFKIILGVTLFVLIPGLYIGISLAGLVGVSYAILINKIVLVVVAVVILNRKLNIHFFEIILNLKGAIISLVIASSLVYIIKLNFSAINWMILGLIYFIFYSVIVLYFERMYFLRFINKIVKP